MTNEQHAARLERYIGPGIGSIADSISAGAKALRKPPGAGRLSNYAFRKYGNDALLYNGVKELEGELAAALRDVEGAKAALEVAQRERDEAKKRSDFFEKEAMDWGHKNATLVVQRDAARADAANVRDALRKVEEFAGKHEITELCRVRLGSPTIGEWQAEAAADELERLRDHIQEYVGPDDARDQIRRICFSRAKDLRAASASLRGGGK